MSNRRNGYRMPLGGTDWMMKEFVGMDWVWRDSVKPRNNDSRWWYPASVPGSVLNDLIANDLVPDPYFEMNSKLVEWVPARTWVYKKSFFPDPAMKGKKIYLCFDGIDYQSEIFLNGVSLGRQEGMYLRWEKDITEQLDWEGENLLAVVLEPAPQEQPQVGKTSLVSTHKSRMTYWWDFCPRMIHQGIWQDVFLKAVDPARITSVFVTADLKEDYTRAEVAVSVETDAGDGAKIRAVFGEASVEGKTENGRWSGTFSIQNPRLWWCAGQGEAYEYPVSVTLYNGNGTESDRWETEYGIREVIFEKNEGVREEKSARGSFLMKINGRPVFMNGINWVPADVLYGAVKKERLEHLIRLAKEAGVNILRVWGGGLIETETFYRLCARAGILVWQEFILSSSGIENRPSERKEYLEMMKDQAERIIKSRRNETALAVWCGGNELQELDGTPLDESHPLLRMMEETVQRLDPGRKWLPTSPSGGVFLNNMENICEHPEEMFDVHGPWEHQGLKAHYELYNQGQCLLHSEFGVEGMTNFGALHKTLAPEHFLPASKDNIYYFHKGAWWDNEPLVQEIFGGSLAEIEQIRKGSQFMQYEGLKYALERNRARAFQCSGTFPWQLNEPYPNLFCTSSVDYYGNPKPAYYGIRKAYAPYAVTAEFESPCAVPGSVWTARIGVVSNQHSPEEGDYHVKAVVFRMDGTEAAGNEWRINRLSDRAVLAGELELEVPKEKDALLLLRLELYLGTEKKAENEYLLTTGSDFGSVYQAAEPELEYRMEQEELVITNHGKTSALFLYLTSENGGFWYWDENYVCLLPGEQRRFAGRGTAEEISVQALNLDYRTITRR